MTDGALPGPGPAADEAESPGYRFAIAPDGVSIAYTVHGSGPPLVFVRGWVSHLELMWADRHYRAFFQALARAFTVLRFDSRGNGLSDRNPEQLDFDSLVADLETVADAAALDRFVLFGSSFGGPIAVAYAAKHPERVTQLVVAGAYAEGIDLGGQEHFLDTLRNVPQAGALLLSRATAPDPDNEAFARADRIWRSVTPDGAARLYGVGFALDIREEAAKVICPALVMHRRGSRVLTFEMGRKLAARIPGAEFVALEGKAQNPWEGDANQVLATMGKFLGVELGPLGGETPVPVTILFTDMEGSTTLTQRLGDEAAQEVLRRHNDIVRRALSEHGGTEIKHTGDGIMASFRSSSQGLDGAVAIQRAFRQHNDAHAQPIRVRVGLNAGEPVPEDEDLFGTAVQVARRVCDAAEPDTILATSVVRELTAGRGFLFRDHGEARLKGLNEPVKLYEVRWQE